MVDSGSRRWSPVLAVPRTWAAIGATSEFQWDTRAAHALSGGPSAYTVSTRWLDSTTLRRIGSITRSTSAMYCPSEPAIRIGRPST